MVGVRSSKLWGGMGMVLVICCFGMVAQGKYGGGSGEPNDPYQIWGANDMQAIGDDANDWDKHFILMADTDLSQFDGKEGREKFNVIAPDANDAESLFQGIPFAGVFDGNDHTISNFVYDSNGVDFIGLFGCVDDTNAEIKNLGLIDPNVTAGTGISVGSLVGRLFMGAITNCYAEGGSVTGDLVVGGLVGDNFSAIIDCHVTGNVLGDHRVGGLVGYNAGHVTDSYGDGDVSGDAYVGGLAGESSFGTITDCHSNGDVSGGVYIGGLVGESYFGTIIDCYSSGSVTGEFFVGGLCGYNIKTTIIHCYVTGSVLGDYEVGGLVGYNSGYVTDSYSNGSASGDVHVGGIVGDNRDEVTNCCAFGSVDGNYYVGGLAGINSGGQITNSYWDSETSNEPNMCGNEHDDCNNGCGLPTSEMHQQATFTDWDFINVWDIGENQTYPYLRTVPAGDINKDRITNFLDLCIVAEQWMREE